MKNIFSILADAGVELTDEQKTAIDKDVKENYKTINDYNKQVEDNETLQTTLKETKENLAKFDGVDAEALNQKIKDLQTDIDKKDADYQAQIADRDFQDMMKGLIAEKKGRNSKAIMALLDVETLKKSNNQKEDVEKALDALIEAEDSKMLFGEAESKQVGEGDPIGSITKLGSSGDAWEAQMMAAAGISTENK